MFYLQARGLTATRRARHAASTPSRARCSSASAIPAAARAARARAVHASSSATWPSTTRPAATAHSAAMTTATAFDVAARPRRFPDPVASSCTASRSSISTTPPPAEAAGRCSRRLDDYYADAQRQHPSRRRTCLSERATDAVRGARGRRRRASSAPPMPHEIVFTRNDRRHQPGGAELRAHARSSAGDEILISWLEHHSNIVPWQLLCAEQTGATLRVVPIDDRGELDLEAFARLLSPRTQIVAMSATSRTRSARSTRRDDHRAGARRRRRGAGRRRAGGVPHCAVDVQALDCDFYVLLGPQDVRPDRHRRALRQGARCSRRCRRTRAAAT